MKDKTKSGVDRGRQRGRSLGNMEDKLVAFSESPLETKKKREGKRRTKRHDNRRGLGNMGQAGGILSRVTY